MFRVYLFLLAFFSPPVLTLFHLPTDFPIECIFVRVFWWSMIKPLATPPPSPSRGRWRTEEGMENLTSSLDMQRLATVFCVTLRWCRVGVLIFALFYLCVCVCVCVCVYVRALVSLLILYLFACVRFHPLSTFGACDGDEDFFCFAAELNERAGCQCNEMLPPLPTQRNYRVFGTIIPGYRAPTVTRTIIIRER